MYDVEIRDPEWPNTAWSNDTATGSKPRALSRARELASFNRAYIRVVDHTGRLHAYMS